MQINYFRDVPLLIGVVVLLTGFYRNGFEVKACSDPGAPQWLCRLVFLFTGTVLIGFGILGNFTPR
jgi:hypothetical protein